MAKGFIPREPVSDPYVARLRAYEQQIAELERECDELRRKWTNIGAAELEAALVAMLDNPSVTAVLNAERLLKKGEQA